jgi:hypothetical protein
MPTWGSCPEACRISISHPLSKSGHGTGPRRRASGRRCPDCTGCTVFQKPNGFRQTVSSRARRGGRTIRFAVGFAVISLHPATARRAATRPQARTSIARQQAGRRLLGLLRLPGGTIAMCRPARMTMPAGAQGESLHGAPPAARPAGNGPARRASRIDHWKGGAGRVDAAALSRAASLS